MLTQLVGRLELSNVWTESSAEAEDIDEATMLHEKLQQRERELESQLVIEQVKGMLMYGFGLSASEALDVLAALSQRANTQVHNVAERLRDKLTGHASLQLREYAAELHKLAYSWPNGIGEGPLLRLSEQMSTVASKDHAELFTSLGLTDSDSL
ncbi:MAG: ANTAR domain-containing protein [Mycobacterium sp.]